MQASQPHEVRKIRVIADGIGATTRLVCDCCGGLIMGATEIEVAPIKARTPITAKVTFTNVALDVKAAVNPTTCMVTPATATVWLPPAMGGTVPAPGSPQGQLSLDPKDNSPTARKQGALDYAKAVLDRIREQAYPKLLALTLYKMLFAEGNRVDAIETTIDRYAREGR